MAAGEWRVAATLASGRKINYGANLGR